jgi:hypothetical protein
MIKWLPRFADCVASVDTKGVLSAGAATIDEGDPGSVTPAAGGLAPFICSAIFGDAGFEQAAKHTTGSSAKARNGFRLSMVSVSSF